MILKSLSYSTSPLPPPAAVVIVTTPLDVLTPAPLKLIDCTLVSIDEPPCNTSSELDVNPKSLICCEPEIVPSSEPPFSTNVILLSIEDENEPVNAFN